LNGFVVWHLPETRNTNIEIRNKSEIQNLNVPNGSFDIVSGFEIILIIWSFEFVSDFDIRISDWHNLFLRDNFGQRLWTFPYLSAGFGSIFRLFF